MKHLHIASGLVALVAVLVIAFTLARLAGSPTKTKRPAKAPSNAESAALFARFEAIRQSGGEVLVAAPIESLVLRSSPEALSDDVRVLLPGAFLVHDGLSAQTEGLTLVHVQELEGGREGWVNARYAPPIEYPTLAEARLGIVDVAQALYSYEDMLQDIRELAAAHGDLIRSETLGASVEGREIPLIILGNPKAEKKILVQAGIHGREYMTTQLVMKMIELYAGLADLASYRGVSYREMLRDAVFYIVPMANPDGVSIAQFGEAAAKSPAVRAILRDCYAADQDDLVLIRDANTQIAWYDNFKHAYDHREPVTQEPIDYKTYLTLWKANARGVDLNANFDAAWEELEVRDRPSHAKYRGPHAESEPETQLLRDLALRHNFAAYLSYHARGNIIYYDVTGNTPEASALSTALAECVSRVNRNKLERVETSATVNLGGFSDWVQLSLGRAAVTVEIGRFACPLEAREFPSIWLRNRETWAAVYAGLRSVRRSAPQLQQGVCRPVLSSEAGNAVD